MSRTTPMRIIAIIALLCAFAAASAARRPVKPPPAQGSFSDHLQLFDTTRWAKADGWSNGSPFDNAWSADNVTLHDNVMDLRLDDTPRLGEPYSSGEYRTTGYYGYGCYEASFRPVARPGVVTSFFTYAGPYDNGGNGRHNEIDIEFLGYDTRRVQLNFWTNDDDYVTRNEQLIDLGFDAALGFHAYAFKWTAAGIRWYVDGSLVYEVTDSATNPTPRASESLQKIMMNLWPVDGTAAAWAGSFSYPGAPLHALYDWVRYTAGEDCEITAPPAEPPAPGGDPAALHVMDIAMSLDARATQAIARVTVVDGTGRPAAGAAIAGAWSGIIASGDTGRTTDANGVATFYSARTRNPGAVTFCVTGIARAGGSYDAAANLETCDAIVK